VATLTTSLPSWTRSSMVAVAMGAILLLTLAVVARAVDGPTDPRHAAELMARATADGDADALAALYAPNAILLAPGAPPIVGRDAIRSIAARNAQMGKTSLVFGDIRMDQSGEAALVLWEWTRTTQPAQGNPVASKGRSMVYFRKSGDLWLIVADMFQASP
jgi:uncharacterized protein (TIGR02246 family)